MNFLTHIAPHLKLYLTLERVHPTRTYNYAKRGLFNLPVIEVTQHGPKCKQGESWMYIATPVGASHATLKPEEHLYVGAQTQDRMFRGDGLEGANYHHADMRAGNGNDTPLAMLRSGQRIAIHRISAADLASTVKANADLHFLLPLLQQPKSPKKHIGFWFEQYCLFAQPGRWRWNTAAPDKSIAQLLSGSGAS